MCVVYRAVSTCSLQVDLQPFFRKSRHVITCKTTRFYLLGEWDTTRALVVRLASYFMQRREGKYGSSLLLQRKRLSKCIFYLFHWDNDSRGQETWLKVPDDSCVNAQAISERAGFCSAASASVPNHVGKACSPHEKGLLGWLCLVCSKKLQALGKEM